MFSSLRFRLWLTYLLVVGLIVLITGTALAVFLYRNPPTDRRELIRLRLVATMAEKRSRLLGQAPSEGESLGERLQEMVDGIDESADARIIIFGPEGELVADSRQGEAAAVPRAAFLLRWAGRLRPIFKDPEGNQWLYATRQLEDGNLLVVTIPRPRTHILALLSDELLDPLLRSGLVAIALSLLMAFGIARWITAPLQRLGGAAQAVSQGEYTPSPVEGPREVQELSKAFNTMVERVQANHQAQRDFIANVSHDLKTPLTSIQGFAQAILDGAVADPQGLEESAQIIHHEASRMHRMVNELLELARLDSGVVSLERKELDLNRIVEAVIQNANLAAQRAQVDIIFIQAGSETGASPLVLGDGDRLGQVFANLLDNALKYSPAQSQVDVIVEVSGGEALVRVADQGPGIPEGEQERIFERFYQTDKARRGGDLRGVGLGLAIAREIVQAHGGSLSVQNAASGLGSVFTVRLPLLTASQAPKNER